MFIAVCDDDVQAHRQISDILDAYAGTCRQLLHYQLFENAEDMLRAAGTERFTHYFLDVMMPGMDGMAAAKEIRAFDSEAKLVFLTSFSEYAYQSYRVRAYDYLLKPVQKETLTELLDRMRAEEAEACIDILRRAEGEVDALVPTRYCEHETVNLLLSPSGTRRRAGT